MKKIVEGLEVEALSVKSNHARLDERGREILDGRPMEPPIGFRREPSLSEQIRAMVRKERLQQELEASGYETFEEANDFYVEDEGDFMSGYEIDEDTPLEEALKKLPKEEAPVKEEPPAPVVAPQQAKGGGGGPPPVSPENAV